MTRKSIRKFAIANQGTTEAKMPVGANIVYAGIQRGLLTIWAEVDPSNDVEARCFTVIETGWEFPADWPAKHLATWFEGPFVWHLYEEARP